MPQQPDPPDDERAAVVILERLQSMVCHALWPSRSIDALEQAVDRYLFEVAHPALGLPGEARPSEPAGGGRVTLVRRWTIGDAALFVRVWRYDRLVRPAREQAHARALLGRAGLRTPELLWVDDRWATLRRFRLECAIERAAPGRPLHALLADPVVGDDTADGQALRATLADDLRRLHTVAGPTWGKPWRPLNPMRQPIPYWLDQIRHWHETAAKGTISLDPARIRRALERLASHVRRFEPGLPRLVHGDLSPAHLFWDGASLVWIDFGTIHYGHPAEDLAVVRRWIGGESAWEALLVRYLGDADADRSSLLRAIELFDELRLWVKWASRVAKRTRHAGRPERRERLLAEQERVEQRLKERYLD